MVEADEDVVLSVAELINERGVSIFYICEV